MGNIDIGYMWLMLNNQTKIFLEGQLLCNYIDVTDSLHHSQTFSFFNDISVVCGLICTFFTGLPPRI